MCAGHEHLWQVQQQEHTFLFELAESFWACLEPYAGAGVAAVIEVRALGVRRGSMLMVLLVVSICIV